MYVPDGTNSLVASQEETDGTLQKVCLNPKNPNEYVLAFNDGEVYYSLHKDYVPQFKKVASEWAQGKKVPLSYVRPGHLNDEHCRHKTEFAEMDAS
jgi:hypothetical protein